MTSVRSARRQVKRLNGHGDKERRRTWRDRIVQLRTRPAIAHGGFNDTAQRFVMAEGVPDRLNQTVEGDLRLGPVVQVHHPFDAPAVRDLVPCVGILAFRRQNPVNKPAEHLAVGLVKPPKIGLRNRIALKRMNDTDSLDTGQSGNNRTADIVKTYAAPPAIRSAIRV